MNDWELGIASGPHLLIARILGTPFPNLYLIQNERSDPNAYPILYITDGGVSQREVQYIGGFTAAKPKGAGSSFPYGFNVEPDRV